MDDDEMDIYFAAGDGEENRNWLVDVQIVHENK